MIFVLVLAVARQGDVRRMRWLWIRMPNNSPDGIPFLDAAHRLALARGILLQPTRHSVSVALSGDRWSSRELIGNRA